MSWGCERNDNSNWIIECEDEDQGLKSGSVVHLKSKFHLRDFQDKFLQSNSRLGIGWGEKNKDLAWVLEFPVGLYSGQLVHLQSLVTSQFWRGNCKGDHEVGFCWDRQRIESGLWLIEADDEDTVMIDQGSVVHLKCSCRVLARESGFLQNKAEEGDGPLWGRRGGDSCWIIEW